MEPRIKTTAVLYNLMVNGTLAETCLSLGKARKEAKKLPLTDEIKEVKIVKQTVTEQVIDIFKIKTEKVLVAGDWTFEGEDHE